MRAAFQEGLLLPTLGRVSVLEGSDVFGARRDGSAGGRSGGWMFPGLPVASRAARGLSLLDGEMLAGFGKRCQRQWMLTDCISPSGARPRGEPGLSPARRGARGRPSPRHPQGLFPEL